MELRIVGGAGLGLSVFALLALAAGALVGAGTGKVTAVPPTDREQSIAAADRWSHKVPLQSGKIDYAFPFEPGVIQVIHAPGQDIGALLAQYGLPGPATHANTPPFTDFDRRAGLDRSYRVAVPVGTEKETVTRLARHPQQFQYVGLLWIAPPELDAR